MFTNHNQIAKALNITNSKAKRLLAKYRKRLREDGFSNLDRDTIPVSYFVKEFAKDSGIPSNEVKDAFEIEKFQ